MQTDHGNTSPAIPPDHALDRLYISKYLFQLRATTEIRLVPFKGSAFHGGFGHALKKISPLYCEEIFGPGQKNTLPRPFVLLPPLDRDTRYEPGRTFNCELTLFGSAHRHFSLCHAALDFLGRQMGLGSGRGKYSIEDVHTARPPTDIATAPDTTPTSGRDIAAARSRLLTGRRLTLHLPTRLRLKAEGRLMRQAPPFNIFFARLLGRLNTLAVTYGTGKLTTREQRDSLLARAGDIQLTDNQTTWQDLPRYSGRQQSRMKFGGLLGSITYEGDLQPFLPYLALGEWTHTGGKTSFGLGKYVMERND